MKPILLISCLLASACSATPTARLAPANASGMAVANDPFPVPKSGLTLPFDQSKVPTLDVVLSEFQRVTGVHVVVAPEVAMVLSKSPSGLSQALEAPASRVYSTVENLLAQNGFVLTLLQTEQPIMVGVESAENARMPLRAWVATAADIDAVANHPALIVSTTVTVPNVNVRDLCNSMRQMFQNPRVQQIIPLGNANSVVMTGRGSEVAGWVHLLLALDADEGRAQAENAKHDAQRSPPKKDDSPPK